MTRSHLGVLAVTVAVVALGSAAEAQTAAPPALLCKLPPGALKLPRTAQHGDDRPSAPVPDREPRDACPAQARAQDRSASSWRPRMRERWRRPAAAERAGYDMRTRPRRARDQAVYFFHAERDQERRSGSIFNAARPKALIYANAPGRPLILVGAMWSTRDGELGPTPAGPILRWHSHIVCKSGTKRGLKPPPSEICPPGSRLTQGTSEMLHVWFTGDLRSAFAISAPRPELCAVGLLPRDSCG